MLVRWLPLALVGVVACDADVIVTIDDPDGHATGATVLVTRIADREAEVSLDGREFPLTQAFVSRTARTEVLLVEARADDGTALARGRARLTFRVGQTGADAIDLGRACADDAVCDDGRFENGAERCEVGVCAAGDAPCRAAVACVDVVADEASASCVTTVHHDRCPPITLESGGEVPSYCDARAGCLPGDPCDEEGVSCPPVEICGGPRTCVSGRCVPTGTLDLDDENPCTIDVCTPASGIAHLPDIGADGNACPSPDARRFICLAGACAESVCGDGHVDAQRDEACDDGADNADAPNHCRLDCRPPACGDAIYDFETEACDDGNLVDEDACLSDCTRNVCGDGIVDTANEACDDGNTNVFDGCLPGCFENVCGDGLLDVLEETCDDGNTTSQDGCSSTCTRVAWRVDVGPLASSTSLAGWSSPTAESLTPVAMIGIATLDGELIAWHADTGVELWRAELGAPVSSPVRAGDVGIYVLDDDGVLHAFSLDGLPRFSLPLTGEPPFAIAVGTGTTEDHVVWVDALGAHGVVDQDGARPEIHDGNGDVIGTGFGTELGGPYPHSTASRDYDATATCTGCVPTLVGPIDFTDEATPVGVGGMITVLDGAVWVWNILPGCAPTTLGLLPGERAVGHVASSPTRDASPDEVAFFTTSLGRLGMLRATGPNTCALEVTLEVTAMAGAAVTEPLVVPDVFAASSAAVVVADDAGRVHRLSILPSDPPTVANVIGWPFDAGAPVSKPPAASANGDLFVFDDDGVVHGVSFVGEERWRLPVGAPPAGGPLVDRRLVYVATTAGNVLALEGGGAALPGTKWSREGGGVGGTGATSSCAAADPRDAGLVIALLAVGALRRRRLSRAPRAPPP